MMTGPAPGDAVFTTMPYADGQVAFAKAHIARMRGHAERLRIPWPASWALSAEGDDGMNLCRVQLTREGDVEVSFRRSDYPASPLCAISQPAPRWARRAQGTKHADWDPYSKAREAALRAGADIALLVHDGAVVDGDRCTPLLLDHDGTVWAANPADGGVQSITLDAVLPGLAAAGLPLRRGRLNETLLGRAREVIVVGSGVGVAWLDEIDGQQIADAPGPLHAAATAALKAARAEDWTPLAAVKP